MCTVSWRRERSGYDLFFNRDELNTRAPEQPPARREHDGVGFLAPRDGDHGGTWLLANEFGVTVCLLNDYGAAWRPEASLPRASRGHLVLACAGAADLAAVLPALDRQPLVRTPAFHLLALAPGEAPLVLHWDGENLGRQSQAMSVPPLSSSSYETGDVIAMRQWRFGAMAQSASAPELRDLAAYHRQHESGCGSHSVLMRRPDAATRSIIHVAVGERQIALNYEPVRWTLPGPVMLEPTRLTLARRARVTLAA